METTPEFKAAGVPPLASLARTQEDREALAFFYGPNAFGGPFILPPGVPEARVALLRKAFREVFGDPEAAAEAQRLNIDWAPLAGLLPRLTNFFTQTPGLAALSKWIAGVAQQRSLPKFAGKSFRSEIASRALKQGGRPVMLWADTFTNTMHPQIGVAALDVLEAAGCAVTLPQAGLCCGRPLYDFGFLDKAKAQLAQILEALAPQIEAGVPLVGLEPSCLAVFRDELLKLFPDDPRAKNSPPTRLCWPSTSKKSLTRHRRSVARPCCTVTATRRR